MDEIETIVKTEVTVISRDIAQQVADRATAELTDRFALKTDVQSLTNTVTSLSNLSGTVASHTAQLTTLNSLATNTSERLTGAGTGAASNAVLGGNLVQAMQSLSNNVIINSRSGTTTHMRWDGVRRSPVQAIDYASAANFSVPTLDLSSLFLTYTDTALVANIRNQSGNLSALYLKDAGEFATNSSHALLTTTVTSLGALVDAQGTTLVRLTGSGTNTNSNAVFGGANVTTLQSLTNNVLIGNKSGSTTYMRWNGATRSPIQAIDNASAAGFAVPTLENNSMFLSYNNTSLVADIQKNDGTSLSLNLRDAATFATASDHNTLTGRVNTIDDTLRNLNVPQTADLQLLVAGLNGSSADKTVVLGARPDTVAAGDTLICDYNKFTLMRWADGGKSAVQSIAPLGSIPSLINRE
jgi:hypothetical protein